MTEGRVVDEPDPAGADAGLRAANAELRGIVEWQAAELQAACRQIEALSCQVAEQQARIEQLVGLVEQLKAWLGQNPRNSSVPPSSEGYARSQRSRGSVAS